MPEANYWQSSEGQALLNDIVRKRAPAWTSGLKDGQRSVISKILDGENVLWIAATGEGKSAAFQVPILVHDELGRNPGMCPRLKAKEKPVGIVVTPNKGLSANIVRYTAILGLLSLIISQVHELSKLSISAFAYTHDNLTNANKQDIDIVQEISQCKYRIICVDPEHLKTEEWRRIAANPFFRSNLVFACAEEAHLIDEWGNPDFRPDFRYIGTFFNSRLPTNIPVFALSATLEPGESTSMICRHLGFRDSSFHLIRGSNERPNTQFIIQHLTHGVGGEIFPQLLPYLSSGRKAIIHCQTLETVYRVFVYLMSFIPEVSYESLRRVRVYHSLCSDKYNLQTLEMLENDLNCQVVIATIAFSNGINVRTLLDSISLGTSSSFNMTWQEKGRVGRYPSSLARGVLLVSPATVKKAEKYMEGLTSTSLFFDQY
jgi:superfamily II DNA helicase RecQ